MQCEATKPRFSLFAIGNGILNPTYMLNYESMCNAISACKLQQMQLRMRANSSDYFLASLLN